MGFKKIYKDSKSFDDDWVSISEEEALKYIKDAYREPEELLEELKLSPGRTLNLMFSLIKYEKDYDDADDKEILDRIYDTIFENVGMSEHHVKFFTDDVKDMEIDNDIFFTINDVRYKLSLERIENDRTEETI